MRSWKSCLKKVTPSQEQLPRLPISHEIRNLYRKYAWYGWYIQHAIDAHLRASLRPNNICVCHYCHRLLISYMGSWVITPHHPPSRRLCMFVILGMSFCFAHYVNCLKRYPMATLKTIRLLTYIDGNRSLSPLMYVCHLWDAFLCFSHDVNCLERYWMTSLKRSGCWHIDGNRSDQCCAAHIVHASQQYWTILLHPIQPQQDILKLLTGWTTCLAQHWSLVLNIWLIIFMRVARVSIY